ncbi:MAG: serine acetyltransferase [Chitinivibrionales bacterium]|nr:serine acetyltransferase [Chitinivibrionales bacterium]
MKLKEWINKRLPDIVNTLEENITGSFEVHAEDGLDLAGRNDIYEVLDYLLAALFPGCYAKDAMIKDELNLFLGDVLRHVSYRLAKHIRETFKYRCLKDKCDDCSCDQRSEEALIHLIESLPRLRALLLEDIQAAFEGDPAAKSLDEIVMSYPCIEAIATHRIAHSLYELDVPIIPRIMSERAHSKTGIDIHPGAEIGPRFFIDHGTGVVIGETCTIGRNVKLYQGVTLGALSFPLDEHGKPIKNIKRHPDIEDDVIIYANATILGGDTVIGKGAVIGANSWITRSVEPGAVFYGTSINGELRGRNNE